MLIEEFIESSNNATTTAELVDSYLKGVGKLGFNRSCYSLLSRKNALHDDKCAGYITNYPTAWIEHYKRSGYIDDDPVYHHASSFRGMIPWSEIELRPLTKKQRTIYAERKAAGLRNGYTLFISGNMGDTVGLTVANDGADVDSSKNGLGKIYAMMNQFNLRCIELKAPPLPTAPPPQLSRRERDVLLWASDGKSNSSIATILGISEKTVEFHFSSVFKKLQVNNRILAVLKALRVHLI